MKFGVHRVDIVPTAPIPMGGYGSRIDPFDGVHDPLTLTAVYLNDGTSQAWIVSADLCQFPDNPHRDAGHATLARRLNCRPDEIFLNASHTHGGPRMILDHGVENIYTSLLRQEGIHAMLLAYMDHLWQKAGDAMEAARASAEPGTLRYAETTTRFPINRRKMVDGKVAMLPNPQGIIDSRLRLLTIDDAGGNLRVLLPVLACHPTATGAQHLLTADYVGAWRAMVEAHFNGSVRMAFLQACGGDSRPAYTARDGQWRTVPHCELSDMALPLFEETLAALQSPRQACGPLKLQGAADTIHLPCEHTFAKRDALNTLMSQADSVWTKSYARACLDRLDRGQSITDQVPVRLQALQMTEDLLLLGMDCEPLCGLGMAIEQAMKPRRALALGYTAGCTCYVPDDAQIPLGGYETESHLWGPWTGPLQTGTNQRFIDGFRSVCDRLR